MSSLLGKKIIVTAGPTIEPIDPVRYISNHSSGKMGYAIARSLACRGAEIVLISGPTTLAAPHESNISRINVMSADDMYNAVMLHFPSSDGAVMCAAVADYTPIEVSDSKLKKRDDELFIHLKRTKDIAAEVGRIKGNKLLVGFALETDNERKNAEDKLHRKNLDFIVLNSLRDNGAGFSGDTNKITIIDTSGKTEETPLESKESAANRITEHICRWFEAHYSQCFDNDTK